MPQTPAITTDLSADVAPMGAPARYDITFPDPAVDADQDQAWCKVTLDGRTRRVRFHDYHEIYRTPGLYEALFYRTLRCSSPVRVVSLLEDVMRDAQQSADGLRVLDVGAGNGMVGAALHEIGVSHVTGIDIIPEAKMAAERDRPWAYDGYHVADLTDLPEREEEAIRKLRLNTLTTVAALGFGDIPDQAFLKALDLVETPAWIAFNIKEDFIDEDDATGFAALIKRLCRLGVLKMHAYRRYCHRLSYAGDPLFYVAMVATKMKDLPDGLLEVDRPASP